jgi:hypothetical protein
MPASSGKAESTIPVQSFHAVFSIRSKLKLVKIQDRVYFCDTSFLSCGYFPVDPENINPNHSLSYPLNVFTSGLNEKIATYTIHRFWMLLFGAGAKKQGSGCIPAY